MTRPFIACRKCDLDLVFTFELSKVAQSIISGFGRFLSQVYVHVIKIYQTYINQDSMASVNVTAAIDNFNAT